MPTCPRCERLACPGGWPGGQGAEGGADRITNVREAPSGGGSGQRSPAGAAVADRLHARRANGRMAEPVCRLPGRLGRQPRCPARAVCITTKNRLDGALDGPIEGLRCRPFFRWHTPRAEAAQCTGNHAAAGPGLPARARLHAPRAEGAQLATNARPRRAMDCRHALDRTPHVQRRCRGRRATCGGRRRSVRRANPPQRGPTGVRPAA